MREWSGSLEDGEPRSLLFSFFEIIKIYFSFYTDITDSGREARSETDTSSNTFGIVLLLTILNKKSSCTCTSYANQHPCCSFPKSLQVIRNCKIFKGQRDLFWPFHTIPIAASLSQIGSKLVWVRLELCITFSSFVYRKTKIIQFTILTLSKMRHFITPALKISSLNKIRISSHKILDDKFLEVKFRICLNFYQYEFTILITLCSRFWQNPRILGYRSSTYTNFRTIYILLRLRIKRDLLMC
jgi:hypothetical protein